MKTFRPYQPQQCLLLPPSLDDWLPEDHLARFVSDLVDQLDLSCIYAAYEREERGYPPYEPSMMFKVLVYAYATGVYSSRKIERRLYEDIAFRYLAAGNFPDFRTICTFRKRHLKDFERLFGQMLKLCRQAGLTKLGTIAIDGTKIKANASKHKAMSYGRMKQEEARLEAEIKRLLAEAEKVDRAEDRRYGDRRGDELPEELRIREKRLAKIREAMRALEAEAKEKAALEHDRDKNDPDGGASCGSAEMVQVDDKAQRNFTDPDSRIMKAPGKHQFIQGYNVQVAVDAETQVIVATEVYQSSADAAYFVPMLDAVEANTGCRPLRATCDAAYFSEFNVREAQRRKIAPFIPPHKVKHSEWRAACPRGPLPPDATLRQRMARFIRTKRGKAIY